MATTRSTVAAPTKGASRPVPKKRKTISKKEAKTEQGQFALHLQSLLDAKGWNSYTLAEACENAGLDVKEHTVRAWLRAENMPKSHQLRAIGKILGLEDPRHILPPA